MLKLNNLRFNRSVITIPLMVALCVGLGYFLLGSQEAVKKADASCKYTIPGSTTYITDDVNSVVYHFSLWYDSCTSSNFTSAHIVQGTSGSWYVEVDRDPGILPGDVRRSGLCPTPTGSICDSPELYSPQNTAYAKINTQHLTARTASF